MRIIFIYLLTAAISQITFAHGEDKPGPNGGHIRMPGNFHTEVIADKEGSFHIFLLDLKFQNPTTKDSEVKAYVTNRKIRTNLKCNVMGSNHFYCKASKPITSGVLVLDVKREGTWASMDAKYDLPLNGFDLKNKPNSEPQDHSKHH